MTPVISNTVKYSVMAALGAAAMYFFDPVRGRRRRVLMRDKLVRGLGRSRRATGIMGRDARHRLQGLAARTHALVRSNDVSDDVLAERVRAALGRATSHPGAIDVSCADGVVTLRGAVLKREHPRLMRAARAAAGVCAVHDELAAYRRANGISALQGGRSLAKESLFHFSESWSPSARVLMCVSGAVLCGLALRRRSPMALLAAGAGSALFVRGAANVPLTRLVTKPGRITIEIQKTLHIAAPVTRVFGVLARYENFPSFMRNVRRVSPHSNGRSHWEVAGPGSVSFEWDAETTLYRPNEALAWRSVRGAPVDHQGIMRLHREGEGTRLDIHLTYSPPADALGHAVARLFGANPKAELDEDLLRLKRLIEAGVPPRDAAAAHWSSSEPSMPHSRSGATRRPGNGSGIET